MNNLRCTLYTVLSLALLITGCNLVNSSNHKGVEITLSSSVLVEKDTILVELKNNSSENILIYGDTMNSQIQKKNSQGDWVRLSRWSIAFTNYYIHLNSNETYQYKVTPLLLSNYTDETEGEYRAIFELVYNQDYENQKIIVSKKFVVQ